MKKPNLIGLLPTLLMYLFSLTNISCNSRVDQQNQALNKVSKSINSQEIQSALPDSIVKFLVNAASRDFHKGNLRMPISFQDVKIGYIVTPNNEKFYILSGQYFSQKKKNINEWVPFASIKTSGVEQWNGAIAMSFYNESQVIIDRGEHLSSALKRGIWNLKLRNGEMKDFPLKDLGINAEFLQFINQKEINRINTLEASLQEVFIKITGKSLHI